MGESDARNYCGEATVDRSRVGLYFGEGDLDKLIATTFAVNTGFVIPLPFTGTRMNPAATTAAG